MSRLVLIRHAQANFSREPDRAFHDYDRLSSLGELQAERLGEELHASGTAFSRVCVGPAMRHRQTAEAVASVYLRHGAAWPEAESVGELDEHQGSSVVERVLGAPGTDEELVRVVAAGAEASGDEERVRAYFHAFRVVTRRWARGELSAAHDAGETWRDFRSRVERGMRRILEGSRRGETIAVFTSGGPIGSTVAWALALDDEAAIELAWAIENATVTELLHRDGRMSLKSFNTQPRIGSVELRTYV
jgi:broad specificity phosphatase PhoE